MRASAIACSLAMRAFSMVSRAEICACSASVSRNARSRATSVRCSARRISMSRSWSRRAVSLSRSISSAWRSASRLRVRILIIESCSMSLRSLRLASMSSIRRVRPSASNRFDGLKYSRSVWSRSVMATDSSSSPFCASASAAAALSRVTYSPRCSCICSMVISAATERIAETNLPESRACNCSGSSVRRPSVAAAIATASRVACTRT